MKKSHKVITGTVIGTLLGLVILLNTAWVQLGHGLWSAVRVGALFWLTVLAAIVILLVALVKHSIAADREKARQDRRINRYRHPAENVEPETEEKPTRHVLFYSIAAATFIGAFFLIPLQSFMNTSGTYKATQVETTTDAASLSFDERVPYDVAKAVSDRSLGDTLGNSTGSVKAIPMSDEYTTSVIRRGLFQGYESVQTMKLPLYGAANTNNDVTFCKYSDEAGLRLGGMGLNNNLNMRILMGTSPSTQLDAGDAVAICKAKDEPVLYVPLTKLEGGLFPHRVPAGVAIYNGKTGDLTIEKEVIDAPVPVYPLSIAADQRESASTSQGFSDWFFKRAGFETTDKDGEDPNKGNNTEFAMKSIKDDQNVGLYTTPLTPRGSSSSIVGISTIASNSVESGELNPMGIHRYEEGRTRDANSTVAATIVSTVLEGYKANGLTVFEVVPSEDGAWTASIGKEQSILYRANIAADGHTVKLVDSSGSESRSDMNNPGNSGSVPTEGDVPVPTTGKPVAEMSPEELKALADSITSELAKRAAAAQG